MSWRAGEEAAGTREGWPEALVGSCREVAWVDMTEQATCEALFGLAAEARRVDWTWKRRRHSPFGCPEPTMGDLAWGRWCRAESRTTGSGGGTAGGELQQRGGFE